MPSDDTCILLLRIPGGKTYSTLGPAHVFVSLWGATSSPGGSPALLGCPSLQKEGRCGLQRAGGPQCPLPAAGQEAGTRKSLQRGALSSSLRRPVLGARGFLTCGGAHFLRALMKACRKCPGEEGGSVPALLKH